MADSADGPSADKDAAESKPAPKRPTTRRRRTTSKPASDSAAGKAAADATPDSDSSAAESMETPDAAAAVATPDEPTETPAEPAPVAPTQPPVTAAEPTATATVPAPAPPTRGRSRWRTIGAWILTVLTGIAFAAALVGYWAHETILNTDRFMAAVTPAVESDAVKSVVADRLADQALEALDLDTRVREALDQAGQRMTDAIADALDLSPDQVARLSRLDGGLQLLAGSIAGGLETRIRDRITDFVMSRDGDGPLVDLVTTLHQRTVLLLRDETDQLPSVDVEQGEVRLNLVPMIAESIRRVVNAGVVALGGDRQIPEFTSGEDAEQAIARLAGVVGKELPPDFGQVRVMDEEQLRNAQALVKTFDRLVWVLIIVAIVLAIAAVLLSPSLTAGLLRVGAAVAVAVLLAWVAVDAISGAVASAARTPDGQAAVADLTSAVVHSLQPLATVLIVVGLVVALGAFVFDRRAADVTA